MTAPVRDRAPAGAVAHTEAGEDAAAGRDVYFVGAPWKAHAAHSGYEVFCDHVGRKLWRFPRRDLPGFAGKVVDRMVGLLVGRRYYTAGNLLTELFACGHALVHPQAHYHVLYGDTDVVLFPRLLRVLKRRASATVHLPQDRLPADFQPRLLRAVDPVVFLAESHRAAMAAGYDFASTVVVHHPVDTDFFSPSSPPNLAGPRVLLSVGGHLRDFDTLAQASSMLLADGTIEGVELVGVPDAERRFFDRPELRGPVRFVDGIDDVALRDRYRTCRVLVLSLVDAYANNALLEAMACGCLIVGSDVGAVREYLGEAGLVCPPADPAALAAAIRQALADPARAQLLGAAAREQSLRFDVKVVAARFRQLVVGR